MGEKCICDKSEDKRRMGLENLVCLTVVWCPLADAPHFAYTGNLKFTQAAPAMQDDESLKA